MVLRAGYLALATKLQEAASKMSHADIQTRLSDCLREHNKGTGTWGYLINVFGDDKAGDVVYSCDSELKKAPYAMSGANCSIDFEKAVDVMPLTTYEVVTETDALMEAGARNSRRDLSQLQTIHDSARALGANCSMAEAKRKTPPAETQPVREAGTPEGNTGNGSQRDARRSGSHEEGQGQPASGSGEQRESDVPRKHSLQLVESASTLEVIRLQEAKADYEIKLIAPGKGSSAFYPAEVLKRDGPKVFKAGTHVYLNHPTAAEEAQRPEGDVKNLAGVLSTTAAYHESHAKGPGLYARMKVFADHGQLVEEKAPHVGMSIRASGVAESDKRKDGVPVLKELTSAESVDVVTRAGAGGMILTEAARGAESNQGGADMDAAELKKLQESLDAQAATNKRLLERALRGDARELATKTLNGVSLTEASKARVVDTILERELPLKDGELDTTKFAEAVNAEAKREGAYVAGLIGSGQVRGMGTAVPAQESDPAKIAEAQKRLKESAIGNFERLGMPRDAAERAVAKEAA